VGQIKKVVLAYSGGLDTSIIIPWLKENYGCEVIALIGDVGQGEELEPARKKALKTGASKAIVADLTKDFVEQYCYRAIKAQAKYEGIYLLGTSLRVRHSEAMVKTALKEGRRRHLPWRHRKGNDQVRSL
jgi:argininosuccinate synthase